LEEAFYQMDYELNNRPNGAKILLTGVKQLLKADW
jgi:predicted trehalose synthase